MEAFFQINSSSQINKQGQNGRKSGDVEDGYCQNSGVFGG